jgi:hypothetical protein
LIPLEVIKAIFVLCEVANAVGSIEGEHKIAVSAYISRGDADLNKVCLVVIGPGMEVGMLVGKYRASVNLEIMPENPHLQS